MARRTPFFRDLFERSRMEEAQARARQGRATKKDIATMRELIRRAERRTGIKRGRMGGTEKQLAKMRKADWQGIAKSLSERLKSAMADLERKSQPRHIQALMDAVEKAKEKISRIDDLEKSRRGMETQETIEAIEEITADITEESAESLIEDLMDFYETEPETVEERREAGLEKLFPNVAPEYRAEVAEAWDDFIDMYPAAAAEADEILYMAMVEMSKSISGDISREQALQIFSDYYNGILNFSG